MKSKKRPKLVGLSLTEDEFELVRQAAENERIGIASYIRNQLFKSKSLQRQSKKEEVG